MALFQVLECAIRIGCPVALRTNVRTVTSYTLTKISRIDRLPYFLTHGAHDAETNILNKYLRDCQGRMLIAVRKEEGS